MPFIVYEGDNLCSKSTQLELQAKHLAQSYRVKTVKTATPTEIGLFAKNYSLKHPSDTIRNFYLYMADVVSLTQDIKAETNDYDFILCDRYFWTTLAVNNIQNDKRFDPIIREMLERGDLVYPDQTVFFRVSSEEQKRRACKRAMNSLDKLSMNEDFHNRFEAEYERLSKTYPGWVIIDTDKKTADEIACDVESKIVRDKICWDNPFGK